MNIASISLRNIRIRLMASVLTAVSIVVATGLYAAIMLMIDQTDQRYKASISGYQAVIGTKDQSQLELVLNTIFNVGHGEGLIRKAVYDDIRRGRLGRRTQVRHAIPQARGDSFSHYNFPVIGTTEDMFTKFERDGKQLEFAVGEGWSFSDADLTALADDLAQRENAKRRGDQPLPRVEFKAEWKRAVLGARVARTIGLEIGDEIVPMHGKASDPFAHEHPEAACKVTGILAPTNSPLDSSIFIPLGAHYMIDGHAGGRFMELPPGPGQAPLGDAEVSAADLALTAIIADPIFHLGAQFLRREFSSRTDAQTAWPQDVVPKFLRDIGSISDALRVIAYLVLLVAAVSISVSIYNTMNERRREIAIMRSLGARRLQITSIILLESVLLSLFGAVAGVLACHATAWFMQNTVEDMTGVFVDWTAFSLDELWLILAVTVLGAVAGILPAVKGSRTQVHDNLAPNY